MPRIVAARMTLLVGVVAFLSLALSALAHRCLARRLGKHPARATALPPITVLKPLRGVDEALRDNLRAIFDQDYPNYEVVLCAADPNDPALDVAREMQERYRGIRVHVLSGGPRDGLNPKVRSLRRMLTVATHDWLLVSDSNVRPERGYLRALMDSQAASGAALVHNLLVGTGGRGLGARLQNLQLNTWVASKIAFADAGGHPSVIGKSMLIERSALERAGGFEGVKDVLAEDYVLGLRMHEQGGGVSLSHHRVPVVDDTPGFTGFIERQLRWAQMRSRAATSFYLGEIFAHPLPFFVAFAWLGGPEEWGLALLGMTTKWLLDAQSCLRMLPGSSRTSLLLLPLKDALMVMVWAVAGVRTRVRWRGHQLRVGAGSRLAPAEPSLVESWIGRA